MIDGRRLEIPSGGIFQSYIKPLDNPEEYGLDPIEDEALQINKITKEQMDSAPSIKVVWPQFVTFINQYNTKKQVWTAPILAGQNNTRFDDIICERIIKGNRIYHPDKKEPYKLGPVDQNGESILFHPRDQIDLMKWFFYWFENDQEIKGYGMDFLRQYFGINTVGSHNAVKDSLDCAFLLIKFLKLSRYVHERMSSKFKNSFNKENEEIQKIVASL